MQFSLSAALAILSSLAATALAQNQQSQHFRLQLCSTNGTLDKQYLYACHTGAAAESLCPGKVVPSSPADSSWTFGYNFTTGVDGSNSGLVTWQLPVSGMSVSQTFTFVQTTAAPSNTEMILITFSSGPGKDVTVGFDDYNNMFVPDSADKRVRYYRWYMCETSFGGYRYTTLNWVKGTGAEKPDNPTCFGVDVKRMFI